MKVKRWRMGCGCGVAEDAEGKYVEWKELDHVVFRYEELWQDFKDLQAAYRVLLIISPARNGSEK